MNRFFPAVLMLTGLAACASGGTGADTSTNIPTATPPRIADRGVMGGADIEIASSGPGATVSFAVSPDQIYAALPAIYEQLGIPVGTRVDAERKIGNSGFIIRRRLGTDELARIVRCGQTAQGLPTANVYRVNLSVMSYVIPGTAGQAGLRTDVNATATSTEGTSNAPVQCASTGALEQRIANQVRIVTTR